MQSTEVKPVLLVFGKILECLMFCIQAGEGMLE